MFGVWVLCDEDFGEQRLLGLSASGLSLPG